MELYDIKIRAQLKEDGILVKILIDHPMEIGLRRDAQTNQIIPAHFIQELTLEHNDEPVMTAQLGPAISKNPFLSFMIKEGNEGDKIRVSWLDNQGNRGAGETLISAEPAPA
ncbi:MAG: thiosulfate oxidation carrier complex protein SoxZ [Gammaproteobacteria bacterium RBG_16_57_12]|nr:MAG: thiosulfate oxidation carrier complex protein SoxZ [Gammaproteobacteria bacterium RBG_16_57_12]